MELTMERPATKVFAFPVAIAAADIDALDHVNNIVYLRWVQQAATAHWSALSNEAINKKYVWVVLRHEIDYLQPALLHDTIMAYTWVGKNAGARSERHTQLYNTVTGKKLAEATTTWCLLDATTMRPKRIDADILSLF